LINKGPRNPSLSTPTGDAAETSRHDRAPRSAAAQAILIGVLALLFFGFIALGTWQVERRAWKLDLIERVEQRIHAPATDAPGPAQWPQISAAADEYLRVRINGAYLQDDETLVKASTELGSGFWVLTPLRKTDGSIILINRGFVPSEHSARPVPESIEPGGTVSVTGLLRMTQPGGGFLRHNDPAGNRWFSPDVQAIAAARGLQLHDVAPYFVDADATVQSADDSGPIGGLTVIDFPNNHLVYAITWYVLALMTAVAGWRLGRAGHAP
jgi:surfeit locus 1 family protein